MARLSELFWRSCSSCLLRWWWASAWWEPWVAARRLSVFLNTLSSNSIWAPRSTSEVVLGTSAWCRSCRAMACPRASAWIPCWVQSRMPPTMIRWMEFTSSATVWLLLLQHYRPFVTRSSSSRRAVNGLPLTATRASISQTITWPVLPTASTWTPLARLTFTVWHR